MAHNPIQGHGGLKVAEMAIDIYTVFRKKTPTHIFFHIYMSDE